jgi:hypothetical protein
VLLTDDKYTKLPGVVSSLDSLSVVLENVEDSWWEWLVANQRSFEWKNQAIPVSGRFHNFSVELPMKMPTKMSGTISITEVDVNHKNETSETQVQFKDILPGLVGQADAAVTYPAKNWEWHMPGTYAPDGDIFRRYSYSPQLSNLTDQYGNGYPTRTFPGIGVFVFVSNQKLAANGIAFAAFGTWILFSGLAQLASACIPCAAALGAIASGAATTLGISGKVADDPPGPDPLFRQRVQLEPPALPPLLTTDDRLRQIGELFRLVTRIAAGVDALNTVSNRLRLSRQWGVREAVELHIASRREILSQISHDADALDDATKRALTGLPAILAMDQRAEAMDPHPPEFTLSSDAQAILESAKLAPLTVGMVTAAPQDHLLGMAASARQLADVVRRDADFEM